MRSPSKEAQDLHPRDREGAREVIANKTGVDAQDGVASGGKSAIAPFIGTMPMGVHFAVDLDDEVESGNEEVRDVAAQQWHLAAKGDSEHAGAHCLEEPCFRGGRSRPHGRGALSEDACVLGGATRGSAKTSAHGKPGARISRGSRLLAGSSTKAT